MWNKNRILRIRALTILATLVFHAQGRGGQVIDHEIEAAIEAGDLAAVTRILDENPTLVLRSADTGTTLLHLACGNVEIAKFLIGEGADVNALSLFFDRPLHTAVKAGNLEVFKFLLEKGADINGQTYAGATVLHCLAWVKDPALAKKFYDIIAVKRPVLIDDPGGCGVTALEMCVEKGNKPVAELLLRHGANPHFHATGSGLNTTHLINPGHNAPQSRHLSAPTP